MPVVVSVIVGSVLALWLVLFLWSGVRGARVTRFRAPQRPRDFVPSGMTAAVRDPEALGAAFALTLRGEVLDIAQGWVGDFRGDVVTVADVTVRHSRGSDPRNLTVATLDVDWRWPWMRLRVAGVEAPEVDRPAVPITAVGGDGWVLEAGDETLAQQLVTSELLAWLSRGDLALQMETTPRHLLIAVDGQLPDARIDELVGMLTGVVDHISPRVREQIVAPSPQDEWASGSGEEAP